MKRLFTLFFVAFLCLHVGFAQQKHRKFDYEAYKAEKEKIITKEVDLTEEEAKAFFPLYHEMAQKSFEVNRNVRREMRRIIEASNVSDAEYQKIIEEQLKAKEKEAAIEREYFEKFKKILSAEKIFKITVAESKITKEMLRKHDHK